ncbi:MAG: DUF4136 domain-containing protein [Chromatocurvus sp.]
MDNLISRGERRGITLSAALCLLFAGCATAPPTPDVDYNPAYDFTGVTTAAMYRDSGHVEGENPHQLSDMARDRIDTALQRALAAKGIIFTDDAADADVLVSWHLVTVTKTDVRTYETPVSAGGFYSPGFHPYNRYSRYSCWACMPTRTEVSVRDYTLGTFIVDLIDPAMDKSVWRSVTSSRLNGQFEKDQDKYDAAAAHVLAAFPPG